MPFATANVQRTTLGNLKVIYGDWSGAVGDDNGTIGVEGGRVYLAKFSNQDSQSPADNDPVTTVSVSGAVATITVNNRDAVTNGRFIIVHS